jgi:hypothetical protein
VSADAIAAEGQPEKGQARYDPTDPAASPTSGYVPPEHSRFQKGQKGGPGRPRGAWPRAATARELARGWENDTESEHPEHRIGEQAREIGRQIIEAALAGDLKKVEALAKVIEQVEGKPQEHIDHTGEVATIRLTGFDSPEETAP